jgi:hypothetical protein
VNREPKIMVVGRWSESVACFVRRSADGANGDGPGQQDASCSDWSLLHCVSSASLTCLQYP